MILYIYMVGVLEIQAITKKLLEKESDVSALRKLDAKLWRIMYIIDNSGFKLNINLWIIYINVKTIYIYRKNVVLIIINILDALKL